MKYENFIVRTEWALNIKEKVNIWNLIKIKIYCFWKYTVKEINKPQTGRKYLPCIYLSKDLSPTLLRFYLNKIE